MFVAYFTKLKVGCARVVLLIGLLVVNKLAAKVGMVLMHVPTFACCCNCFRCRLVARLAVADAFVVLQVCYVRGR